MSLQEIIDENLKNEFDYAADVALRAGQFLKIKPEEVNIVELLVTGKTKIHGGQLTYNLEENVAAGYRHASSMSGSFRFAIQPETE